MDKTVESALRIIEGTGPAGAVVAGILVALVLGIIIIARAQGLFDTSRFDQRKTDFLSVVIGQYEKLAASEARLRAEAERIEEENAALQDRQRELLTSVELLRAQLRRAIDLLTALRDGRMQPGEIDARLAEMGT